MWDESLWLTLCYHCCRNSPLSISFAAGAVSALLVAGQEWLCCSTHWLFLPLSLLCYQQTAMVPSLTCSPLPAPPQRMPEVAWSTLVFSSLEEYPRLNPRGSSHWSLGRESHRLPSLQPLILLSTVPVSVHNKNNKIIWQPIGERAVLMIFAAWMLLFSGNRPWKQGAADEVKLSETKLWDGEVAVTSRIKASITVVSGCLLESALRRTEADIRS